MSRKDEHIQEAVAGLVGVIYDAAILRGDSCASCDLLPRICGVFSASAGCFLVHDFSTRCSAECHEFAPGADVGDVHGSGESAVSVWIDPHVCSRDRQWNSGQGVFAWSGMSRPGFSDSGVGTGNQLHHLCGVIAQEGQIAHIIGLLRPTGASAFTGGDKAALSGLLPHLARSSRIREKVLCDRLAQVHLTEIIDLLPVAFLLVGRDGQIKIQNRLAEEVIAKNNGLVVGAGGRLAATTASDTAGLRQLLAETATSCDRTDSEEDSPQDGHHLIISRGQDQLPLICVAHPVTGLRLEQTSEPELAIAVFVKDPDTQHFAGLPDVASTYALTRAEARLTGLLATGQGVFEAAEELGITRNTVRTHMRNIYSKVGMHRQTDLIRLLAQFGMF